ncbi:MAG: hypothetical protein H6729_16860 [Deltaproteobacteria bacterium]|nr:hypothetical protein [Deltaproteobacteria bacterium]
MSIRAPGQPPQSAPLRQTIPSQAKDGPQAKHGPEGKDGLRAKISRRLGLDRATLSVGHETFFGLASTAGLFARQRVNFSGGNSGRVPVSVAADFALNLQLWALPGGGFGYMYGTDHALDGPFVDAQMGPYVALHHPDYGNCFGVFLPGLGGILLGREVAAFGATVPIFGMAVQDGGYFFLRHPAIGYVTTPLFATMRWAGGIPLVERHVCEPARRHVAELQRFTKPMRKREEAMFKRGAEALGDIAARIRGKRKNKKKDERISAETERVEQALPAQGTTAPRSSAR